MRPFEEIAKDRRIRIEKVADGIGFIGEVKLTGENGAHMYHIIFTRERGKDGRLKTEHASVSRVVGNKLPGWLEMAELKDIIWQDEEECYQVHPKKSQYVNFKDNCLHIWRDIRENG